MSVRSTIIAAIKRLAEEQSRTLAPLSDSLALIDSGLDSLGFAALVVRLEDALGSDPFNESAELPVTFGDLVRIYVNATREPTRKIANTEPAKKRTKIGSVEPKVFAHNIARLAEEGGKAFAAYLKPREEGKIKSELANDVTDVVKILGQVAVSWLSKPQRVFELQTSLGRACLDLWADAVKRMAGEPTAPVV
jgi:acyl carrier protein